MKQLLLALRSPSASTYATERIRPIVCIPRAGTSVLDLGLFVQDQVQQRAVYLDLAVVIDKPQFAELVHEKTHARSRGADHVRQCFLTDFRQDRLGAACLAKIRQEEERSRKALLAGIEKLIDEVGFDTAVAGQKVGDEQLGKGRLGVNCVDDFSLWESRDRTFRMLAYVRHTQKLPRETSFPEKIAGPENRDNGFFALPGKDGDLGFSPLDIENCIGGIALPIDKLIFPVFGNGSSTVDFREEDFGIKGDLGSGRFDSRLAHRKTGSEVAPLV